MILLAPHLEELMLRQMDGKGTYYFIVDIDDGLYAATSPPAASPRSATNFVVSGARACRNRHGAASRSAATSGNHRNLLGSEIPGVQMRFTVRRKRNPRIQVYRIGHSGALARGPAQRPPGTEADGGSGGKDTRGGRSDGLLAM
jgi:hypothetical protein